MKSNGGGMDVCPRFLQLSDDDVVVVVEAQ